MKLLWITNTIFPQLSRAIGRPEPVIGGWMYGLADRIAETPDIKLAVATVYSGRDARTVDIGQIRFFLLPARPSREYQPALEGRWQQLCESYEPDLVHVHGTENPHGLACMRACPALPYVVSVQGLTSVISRYHYGGLNVGTLLRNMTLRDIARRDSVFHTKRQRDRCSQYERESLRRAAIVIGRTSWDRVHVEAIAPEATYVSCNESLRAPFYASKKWNSEACRPHSIFMSQAHTPMKGLHQVLCAMSLLRTEFPRLKLRIAGHNITARKTIRDRLLRTGYGAYIGKLVRSLSLENALEFLGHLGPDRMVSEYRSARIFVCPSAVENSPNSLGEAQLVGIPVIASCAGGIPDFVEHGKSGLLYRFEEVELLAAHIRKILCDDNLANSLSVNQIAVASMRHDPVVNHQAMIQVYERAYRQRA